MKKKLPVVLGVIATVILAFFLANTSKAHRIYDNNVNTANYTALPIPLEGQKLVQTFVSKENVIDAVSLKCGLSGNTKDVTVDIVLSDAETGEVLARVSDSAAFIKARKMHDFAFAPVENCRDRRMTLEVTEEGTTVSDGVLLYYQQSPEAADKLDVDGTEYDGVLVMRTLTERFDTERFISLLLAEWFIWAFMWALYKLFQAK